ncbi:hypothetical protein [Candidatus Nitrotoga sp. 1052]|uniref:hypothetical protein n=1 Tax=Candidatus Nitrotoga sp. 1052 TaxID=2886964 RepID=UPI001EF4A866|nr:hypothetical protein [Candidatus Nitrotoga sp. 1052]CAH1069043.1 conserved hypothetical protein [Candidatus Nitrotoga sp. 1052]
MKHMVELNSEILAVKHFSSAAILGLFTWCITYSIPSHAEFIEGSAALTSTTLRIPEPLLFDLVRPLGAKKGELEVNTLALKPLKGGPAEWAPEIEYAFADDYAIELELPFEHTNLTNYKFALQGTLSNPLIAGMIQGWQVIGEKNRGTGKYSADALYINGYRLSKAWSTLNMFGIRRTVFGGEGKTIALMNNNLFYDYSQRLTYGIELNHEIDQEGQWGYSLTPQIHLDLSHHINLQTGLGFSRLNENRSAEKLFAMRLSVAF